MKSNAAPIFYISVREEGKAESEALDFDMTNKVLSLTYEDSEKKTDLLKLEVDNWDLKNFDNPIWKPGNIIIVTWGYVGNTAPTRECVIQKVTGGIRLTVEAQGKTVLLNRQVQSTTWRNRTRSSVVDDIAQAAGYVNSSTRFIEKTTEVFDTISQSRQTDAQFVKKLADLEGFEFFIDHSGFHWHPRKLDRAPLRVLQWYSPPDVGDIINFNVETDVFAKPAVVEVRGRDPLNKVPIQGVGSNEFTSRSALAPVDPLAPPGVRIGRTTVSTPWGVRVGTTTVENLRGPQYQANSGIRRGVTTVEHLRGPQYQNLNAVSSAIIPTTETSSAQIRREADGAYRRSVQSAVKLTVEMVGDPGIIAKSVIEIRGISKKLSGLYYITDATHSISSSGYKLTLKCQSDGTHGHVEDIASLSIEETKTNATLNKKRASTDTRGLVPFQIQNKDGTLGPITYVPSSLVAEGLDYAAKGQGERVGIVGITKKK